MKFFNLFPVSNFGRERWASHCDAQGTPVPSRQLCYPRSKRRSRLPKSVGPSNAFATLGNPVASGARYDLSVSSQAYLRLATADTQCADGHDPCSQLLSVYAHSPNRRFGSIDRDNVAARRLSKRGSGISSPTPNVRLYNLLYVNYVANIPYSKDRTFIQTKVTAINCGVSTYN